MVWKIVGALLAIWLAFTVLGVVVKGLFWLAVIGGLLVAGGALLITAILPAIHWSGEIRGMDGVLQLLRRLVSLVA
jgi:hypothetical protein